LKDDEVHLLHILQEADFIIHTAKGLEFEAIMADEALKRAIVWSLEMIGEASRNISTRFKEMHREIEWSELASLRDKLTNRYFEVKWKRVWDAITTLIPDLKPQIETLLKGEEPAG